MNNVNKQQDNETDLAFKTSPFVFVASCFIIALLWLPANVLANHPWLDRQLHLIDGLDVVATLSLFVSLVVTLFNTRIGKLIFMSSSAIALMLAWCFFINFDLQISHNSIAIMALAFVVPAYRYLKLTSSPS